MSTAAERAAEADVKAKAAEADSTEAPPAEAKAPVKSFTLRPALWDVDAVQFAFDGDDVTVTKAGYVVAGESAADDLVAAAAGAGFPLSKEG